MVRDKPAATVQKDERKTKNELLYELRLQRLENLRLTERLAGAQDEFSDRRQLKYLENTALIDRAVRQTTDLDEMMNSLMDVLRAIFKCDQAWLLYPCDPNAPSWRLPFRSTTPRHPIHFGPEDDLPSTSDLEENCRLALKSIEPVPLGLENMIKNVPQEAQESAARSALLIALHPKVGRPWLMGLHQCSNDRLWTPEEKRIFQDISSRIADALSTTLFYRNLEQNQERLKHLSTQLFRAQEEERKRIAEEIHDELGQAVLAIKMGVENALFLLDDKAQKPIRKSLKSAASLASDVVQKIRRMQTSLYPPTLRDFGAITALNGFLNDYENIYSDITVKRNIHINEDAIPDKLRVTVFRLAQEALYNAAKHSRANTVTVVLGRFGCRLILEVIDNGVGFDPRTTIRYPDTRLGLGLTSMRERAEMSDGTMEIDSAPNRGTTIRVLWLLRTDTDINTDQ